MNKCLYAGGKEDSILTSCPMILRSACLHKRTPSSMSESPCHDCSHINLNQETSNGTRLFSTTSESSIEQNKLIQTTKTYSRYQKISSESTESTLKSNLHVQDSEKSIDGFSVFSCSGDNAFVNFLNKGKKLCSSISRDTENTINKLQSSEEIGMSRTYRFTRSSLSSVRGQSGSESDNEASMHYTQARNIPSTGIGQPNNFIPNFPAPAGYAPSVWGGQSNHSFNSKQSSSESGSHLGNSFLQQHSTSFLTVIKERLLEWIRWIVWRFIYIQLLNIKHLDIWILSRVSSFGKVKTCCLFAILLSILLFPLFRSQGLESSDLIAGSVNSLSRGFLSFKQYFGNIRSLPEERESHDSCEPNGNDIFANFLGIISYPFGFFKYLVENLSYQSASSNQRPETVFQFSKEQMKSLALEVWDEKEKSIKNSNTNPTGNNVDTDNMKSNEEISLKAELSILHTEFKSFAGDLIKLQKNMMESSQRTKTLSSLTTEHNEKLHDFNTKIGQLEKKIDNLEHLMLLLKNCCSKQFNASDFFMAFETHLTSALKNISNENAAKGSPYEFFREWLDSKFISNKEFKSEVQLAFETLRRDSNILDEETYSKNARTMVENIVAQRMESMKSQLFNDKIVSTSGQMNLDAYSLNDIKIAIKEAIRLYDADKNGLVDYALESGGGSVLGTRCSETYFEKNARLSVFGVPLWYTSNSPRTAIQPAVHPGECWAFRGTQGFLVIQLSATVRLTGFSLEHIPVSLSPTGNIDSAPKEFSVWGLETEKDSVGNLLGKYVYDKDGEPLQYFGVQESYDKVFPFVELKIQSNHGNPEYTCLYRFRAHGTRT